MLLIPKRHGQTDGRTDRQTDGRLTVALPRSALASRGKNCQVGLCQRWNLVPFPTHCRRITGSNACVDATVSCRPRSQDHSSFRGWPQTRKGSFLFHGISVLSHDSFCLFSGFKNIIIIITRTVVITSHHCIFTFFDNSVIQ